MFEFDVVKKHEQPYHVVITHTGDIIVVAPSGEEMDIDSELAAIELGFDISSGMAVVEVWETISQGMENFDAMLEDIGSSGEVRREQSGYYGKYYNYYHQEIEEYVYKFGITEFLKHIAPFFGELLEDEDDDVVAIAKMLAMIRIDGKPIGFSLIDGEYEDQDEPSSIHIYSWVSRSLYANGVELAEWDEKFESELYDQINFKVDTQHQPEQEDGIAGSAALFDVIAALGLKDKELLLNAQAIEDMSKPCFPTADPTGEFGVMHEFTDDEHQDTIQVVVVPFDSKRDAKNAMSISEDVVKNRSLDFQHVYELTLVRRMGAEEEALARREHQISIEEREFALRQYHLSGGDTIWYPKIPPFNGMIDVWVPLGDDDE